MQGWNLSLTRMPRCQLSQQCRQKTSTSSSPARPPPHPRRIPPDPRRALLDPRRAQVPPALTQTPGAARCSTRWCQWHRATSGTVPPVAPCHQWHLLPPPPSPSSTCTSPQVVGRADGLTLMETDDPLLLLIAVVYLSTAIVFENISVLLSGAGGPGVRGARGFGALC